MLCCANENSFLFPHHLTTACPHYEITSRYIVTCKLISLTSVDFSIFLHPPVKAKFPSTFTLNLQMYSIWRAPAYIRTEQIHSKKNDAEQKTKSKATKVVKSYTLPPNTCSLTRIENLNASRWLRQAKTKRYDCNS